MWQALSRQRVLPPLEYQVRILHVLLKREDTLDRALDSFPPRLVFNLLSSASNNLILAIFEACLSSRLLPAMRGLVARYLPIPPCPTCDLVGPIYFVSFPPHLWTIHDGYVGIKHLGPFCSVSCLLATSSDSTTIAIRDIVETPTGWPRRITDRAGKRFVPFLL